MQTPALLSLIELHLPAAQAGDKDAYARIVRGCQGGITAIALAVVRDVQASEDIAQEAFLSAWMNLRKLRNPSSFLPWLRQITRNLARDHLRRRATERIHDGDMDALLRVVADPSPDLPDRLHREREEAMVAELIDELPEETRELLLIYYREGQSTRQVAELLGLSEVAVRKRLQRARDRLREDFTHRLAEIARKTAPGTAFTSLVLAGLALCPGSASAGVVAGGAAASKGMGKLLAGAGGASKGASKLLASVGGAGKGASKLLLGTAGGVLFALIAGIAGVLLGVRRHWHTAIDRREKRELGGFALAGIGVVVAFTLAMVWTLHAGHALGSILAFALLMLALGLMNLLWLPRILLRRHAAEAARNPVAARLARREERRQAWTGMLLGLILGSAGLALGLWLSHGL